MKGIRNISPAGLALLPALMAVALGVTIAVAAVSGGDGEQPSASSPKWLPGLPLDTPPAEPAQVYNSPPPGQDATWQAIAEIAYGDCSAFGTPPREAPDAMYETTAGEIRRRMASTGKDASVALGSSWANDDHVYVVAFRGDYTARRAPPPAINEETGEVEPPRELPHSDVCIFLGTGSAFDQFGITTLGAYEPTIENLFGNRH